MSAVEPTAASNPPLDSTTETGAATSLARKPGRLGIWLGLLAMTLIVAFAFPPLLVKVFESEENQKAKGPNVVGNPDGLEAPPGHQVDPAGRR